MMRQTRLRPTFVEFIPEELAEGVLYISRRYRTVSHMCCCGCGLEVVTPLNPAKWHLTEHGNGSVSLSPSVGNWSFPCKSHYFVCQNRIEWAYSLPPKVIAAVQAQDRHDAELLARRSWSRLARFSDAVRATWERIRGTINNWLAGR